VAGLQGWDTRNIVFLSQNPERQNDEITNDLLSPAQTREQKSGMEAPTNDIGTGALRQKLRQFGGITTDDRQSAGFGRSVSVASSIGFIKERELCVPLQEINTVSTKEVKGSLENGKLTQRLWRARLPAMALLVLELAALSRLVLS
jgi:hypothetical protein